MQNDFETPRELAQRLGWPERRVRSLLISRQLRRVKVGGMYLVPLGAFDEFVVSHMVVPDLSHAETK